MNAKIEQPQFRPGDRVRYADDKTHVLQGTVTAATVHVATVRWDGTRLIATMDNTLLRRIDRD